MFGVSDFQFCLFGLFLVFVELEHQVIFLISTTAHGQTYMYMVLAVQ
jgi:hypothetical protein